MAVAYVAGQKISAGSAAATSVNAVFPGNVTAGNNIHVGVVVDVVGRTLTVSDSLGNTYALDQSVPFDTNTKVIATYTAKNITGGACTVTFGISGASTRIGISVREFSGEHTTAPLDQIGSGNGADSSVECGSVTMTAAGVIVTVHGMQNNTTTTLDTDYAELSENTTGRLAMGHRVTAAITDQAIHTLSGATDWGASTTTYKVAGGGTTDGEGASAGTSTATSVGASSALSVGASAGLATVTSVGRATSTAVAASAGTSTATSVGIAASAAVGSSAGLSTAAAIGASSANAVAASAGLSTAAAVGAALSAAVGVSAGTSTATAEAEGGGTGLSAGTSTATAVGAWTAAGVGVSAGIATASAVSTVFSEAVGFAFGSSSAVADVIPEPGVTVPLPAAVWVDNFLHDLNMPGGHYTIDAGIGGFGGSPWPDTADIGTQWHDNYLHNLNMPGSHYATAAGLGGFGGSPWPDTGEIPTTWAEAAAPVTTWRVSV